MTQEELLRLIASELLVIIYWLIVIFIRMGRNRDEAVNSRSTD